MGVLPGHDGRVASRWRWPDSERAFPVVELRLRADDTDGCEKMEAPVTPGSTVTIRFVMWDAGNALYDSTVLIDNFQWIATGGTVGVGTTPAQ